MAPPVVLIQSVKGGTGKSLISANLAMILADELGKRVGVVDADIDSPNICEMMGVTGSLDRDELRYFVPATKGDNIEIISMSLFMDSQVLAFTKPGEQNRVIIKDMAKFTAWGDLDIMLVDCPAGSSDELRAIMVAFDNIIGTVVVTLPNTVSDMKRVIDLSGRFCLPIIGVIENMSYIFCDCGEQIHLFANNGEVKEICEEYNINFAGDIPYHREFTKADDAEIDIRINNDYREPLMNIINNIFEEEDGDSYDS